jgi:hypothetical protein
MSTKQPLGRIEESPARSVPSAADDERVVLRISRESLRTEQPAVRFVGRSSGVTPQQRLPWPT